MARYHVNDAPNAIEVELPLSKGRKIAIDIIPESLITHLETAVDVGLAPKALINLYILAIRVIHQF
jgi:hypothetical protein